MPTFHSLTQKESPHPARLPPTSYPRNPDRRQAYALHRNVVSYTRHSGVTEARPDVARSVRVRLPATAASLHKHHSHAILGNMTERLRCSNPKHPYFGNYAGRVYVKGQHYCQTCNPDLGSSRVSVPKQTRRALSGQPDANAGHSGGGE